MTKNENDPDNDIYDLVEEYFKSQKEIEGISDEEDEYFPLEYSKPPHY